MKGITVLLVVASVVLTRADDKCPSEQESDWAIEQLLAHEDCHKFYKCAFGKPVEYVCPAELYFNLELWQCDWKENVDCGDRIDPSAPTTEATTSIEPEPTEEETEPTEEETEPTTELVPETDAYTTEAEAETTPEPTTEEPTTPEPTTEEPTTPEPTTEEPTTPEPTTEEPTTPEPTTEEPTTPEPTTEEPTTPEPTTEEPTTPEPTTEEPTTPEPTTKEPTTPEPTTEEPTPEPEPETDANPEIDFQENGCPVDPHIHWLLPHEEDCNLFYYCVWGQLVLRQCPASLHFNPVLQVCDWPLNAGCAVSFDKHIEGRRYMSQVEVSLKL